MSEAPQHAPLPEWHYFDCGIAGGFPHSSDDCRRKDDAPTLIDWFCCGGGAARGYAEAGWNVIGVDKEPQPDYPFRFVQADAIDLLDTMTPASLEHGEPALLRLGDELVEVHANHASPPCQLDTRARHLRKAQGGKSKVEVNLIDPTRRRLRRLGIPYVIENVPDAPLYGVRLCGSMFGLAVQRHRIFESNVYIPQPACDHKAFPIDPRSGKPRPIGVYHVLADEVPKGGKTAETLEQAQQAMGLELPWDRLKEAIPPAYARYVGEHLMATIKEAAHA